MLQITFIDADGTTHALQVEPGQTASITAW